MLVYLPMHVTRTWSRTAGTPTHPATVGAWHIAADDRYVQVRNEAQAIMCRLVRAGIERSASSEQGVGLPELAPNLTNQNQHTVSHTWMGTNVVTHGHGGKPCYASEFCLHMRVVSRT